VETKKLSLVSARKGKNMGKYIRLNTKQAKRLENIALSEGFIDKSEFKNHNFINGYCISSRQK